MNKTAKNSILYLAGTILMAVVGFFSSVVLTRVLSVEVYAFYGLLTTFVSTAVTISAFGMDASYTRFYYNHGYTQKKFFITCLLIPLVVFCGLFLLLIEPNKLLIRVVFEENIGIGAVCLIAMQIFVTLLSRFTHAMARMEECAVNYIASNFLSRSGFLLVIFVLVLLHKDISFLDIILASTGTIIAAIFVNATVLFRCGNKRGKASEDTSYKVLIKYGLPFVINNSLVLVIPLIERVLVRKFAGVEILGVYTAAAVFSTVILLMQNTLDNIWNPLVYKHFEDEKRFKPLLHSIGLAVTVITAVGVAFCILLRRWLVLILDYKYFDVYIIAPAILYGSCFNIVATIYSVGINIKKKTIHMSIAPVIQIAFSLLLSVLLIPRLGLIGIGITSLISVFFSRLYRIIFGIKAYNTGVSERKCCYICGICMLAALATMFYTHFVADLIIFVVIMILTVLIVNTELLALLSDFSHMLHSTKEKKL